MFIAMKENSKKAICPESKTLVEVLSISFLNPLQSIMMKNHTSIITLRLCKVSWKLTRVVPRGNSRPLIKREREFFIFLIFKFIEIMMVCNNER